MPSSYKRKANISPAPGLRVEKLMWEGFDTGYIASFGDTKAYGGTRSEALDRLAAKRKKERDAALKRGKQ